MENIQIIETVEFRTTNGVTPEQVAAAQDGIQAFLATRDGFIARTLSQGEDGTWLDHVVWANRAAAQSASEALMRAPEAGAFLALIDLEIVKMSHAPMVSRQVA